MTPQSSGWYDDPQDPTHLRYFDGVVWTEHRAPKDVPPTPADPYADPASGAPGASYGTTTTGTTTTGATAASAGGPSAGAPATGQGTSDPYAGGTGIPQAPGWQAPGGTAGGQQYPQYPQGGQQYPQAGYGQGFPQAPGAAYGQVPYGVPMLHGRPLSGWWRRVGASIIDSFVVSLVMSLVTLPLTMPSMRRMMDLWSQTMDAARSGGTPPTTDMASALDSRFYLASLLMGVAYFLYDAVCTARWGRTLGKRVLGIRVVDVAAPANVPMQRAAVRALVKHIDSLVGSVPLASSLAWMFNLVDSLFPLWDKPLRQSIHDKAAKSAVIRD